MCRKLEHILEPCQTLCLRPHHREGQRFVLMRPLGAATVHPLHITSRGRMHVALRPAKATRGS